MTSAMGGGLRAALKSGGSCDGSGLIYLTDESGNFIADPDGNLIVLG